MDRQILREFAKMRQVNRTGKRPIGNAIDVGGKWLWGGTFITQTIHTSLVDLGNGTEINSHTGEVFSI